MNSTKNKPTKKRNRTYNLGTYKEINTVYTESLEELLATEFYKSIKYDPSGKEFLKRLEETGDAKVCIGGGFNNVMVLRVKKLGDTYEYIGEEIEKPASELLDVIGTECLIEGEAQRKAWRGAQI
jgi:hypothetical protein